MHIIFDFSRLSKPYRLKRCTHQMVHLALCAQHLGHTVQALTTEEHVSQHSVMSCIEDMWTHTIDGCDIYIAKSDSFYVDKNFDDISKINAFKVCLSNSDQCFRESSEPWRGHFGHSVQDRCDLYMPVNHTANLLDTHGERTVPTAHPININMCNLFKQCGIYNDYLFDRIDKVRNAFPVHENSRAGFMGSSSPKQHRLYKSTIFPKWVDFEWSRHKPASEYIDWMLHRRGCVDLRGYGDKSLRFTEAVLFNRTVISIDHPSKYYPALVHNQNCLLFDDWESMVLQYDHEKWLKIAENATDDYLTGWSMLAQMKIIIKKAVS